MNVIYLNGDYVPQQEAKVSVFDRGFLFGDGVYESIAVLNGKLIDLTKHLHRLINAMQKISIKNPHKFETWETLLKQLIVKNNCIYHDFFVYIQVTRGEQDTRKHLFPDHLPPTVFAACIPTQHTDRPRSAITLPDERHDDCSFKSICLLPNVVAAKISQRKQADEVIFIKNSYVTEGYSGNVFIVYENQLITPPLHKNIFPGTTRDILLHLAKEHDIPYKQHHITLDMLFNAQEIWITGSIKQIYSITILDNKPVGNGKIGKFWQQFIVFYRNFIYQENSLSTTALP